MERSLTALNGDLLLLPVGLSENEGITNLLRIPMDTNLWIICVALGLIVVMLPLNRLVFQRNYKL